ncbi:MAG: lysophospholipid acyltransferase family protein [Chloroflexota bacterium]
MKWFFFGLAVLFVRAYLKAKSSKLVVLGKENLPARPGHILVSNHLSYIDPLILWSSLRPTIRFWMKTDICFPLLDPVLVFLCRILFGVVPVDRKRPRLQNLVHQSRFALRHDWVGIFPEGSRNPTGRPSLREGFAGMAVLARRTGAPLIPVAIQGTSGFANPLSRNRTVTVTIGRPFTLPERGNREGDTRRIFAAIAELLPEQLRGAYV